MKKPDSVGKGQLSPKPTGAPIVVPRGKKGQAGNPVVRWIRGSPPPPTPAPLLIDSGKEEKPAPAPRAPEPTAQRSTVHMLPGRLEPMDPGVLAQEIRFIRAASEDQVVTLGWNIGEPPEHITLNHSSVKPVHARMSYREREWWIESLNELDPVVVNNLSIRPGDPPRRLLDRDEIRIGQVHFRFLFP